MPLPVYDPSSDDLNVEADGDSHAIAIATGADKSEVINVGEVDLKNVNVSKKKTEDNNNKNNDEFDVFGGGGGDDDEKEAEDNHEEYDKKESREEQFARLKKEAEDRAIRKEAEQRTVVGIEIKPWDVDQDLIALWKKITSTVVQDGLQWGENCTLVPVAFGIEKIQTSFTMGINNSSDSIQETIEAMEDEVQSVEITSMNVL